MREGSVHETRCRHRDAFVKALTSDFLEVHCPQCNREMYYGLVSKPGERFSKLPVWVRRLVEPLSGRNKT